MDDGIKRAVTTAGEAEKHVEGQKVVFTAVPVAADPIVILVDLDEIFSTSKGSSGRRENPYERSLRAHRRIHKFGLLGVGPHRKGPFRIILTRF